MAARNSTDEGKIYKRDYYNKRLAEDPVYRLLANHRSRLNKALKAAGAGKSCRSLDLIGCSPQELRAHIEAQFREGMTWENQGRGGWELDHIRPLSSFDLTDPDQAKQAFHWSNCQPMWASENYSKGSLHEGERHRYAR